MSLFSDDLAISEANLSDELVKQPGLFAHYAGLAATANRKLKMAKVQFDVWEAAIDKKIRDEALAKNNKITETQIVAKIRLNAEWLAGKFRLIDLEAEVEQYESLTRAMIQKKDMLMTIAHDRRAEMRSFAQVAAEPQPKQQQQAFPVLSG